jgi:hypothetical protein
MATQSRAGPVMARDNHVRRAAGTGEPGDRRQHVEKQDGQIAHGTIRRKIAKSRKC